MNFKKLFTKDGNCPTLGDPYRESNETIKLIFDKEGNVDPDVHYWLEDFIKNKNIKTDSDAVKLYYAEEFAVNTKGHYTAIYMWR